MWKRILPLTTLLLVLTAAAGCDDKEDVIDIETPDGSIEVERDKDDKSLDVTIE